MGYDSLRNKEVIKFPNGKMLFFAEVSDSRTFDYRNRRIWDKILIHPKGTLFYTKESLKAEQDRYVEEQFKLLSEFSKHAVESGWTEEYREPTLDDINYYGTVFPSGRRVRHGKSFYSCGKTIDAAEYFGKVKEKYYGPMIPMITFKVYGKDFKEIYKNDYDILAVDVDEAYQDALQVSNNVYLSFNF